MADRDLGLATVRARATAPLFAGGAALVAAIALLPGGPGGTHRIAIVVVSALAAAAALVIRLLGGRFSVLRTHLAVASGSVLTATAIALSGGTQLVLVYPSVFVIVAMIASVLFGWRGGLLHVGLVTAVHAAALALVPEGGRLISWTMTAGIGLAIVFWNRSVERMTGRLRSTMARAGGAILVLDRDHVITSERGATRRILAGASALGRSVLSLLRTEDRERVAAALASVSGDPEATAVLEAELDRPGGVRLAVQLHVDNALDDPAVGGLVVTLVDITERKELEDQLAHQAFHDPLTGLANRALFEDRVTHALEHRRPPSRMVAVLLIDVDDFKTVNDSLGHAAGDRLLVEIAERLRAATRAGDTVARLGGDEFAILLEEVAGCDEVEQLVLRLHEHLSGPVDLGGSTVAPRVSIGGTIEAVALADPSVLLRQADTAMYQAKHRGKGRFEWFDPQVHHQLLRRVRLQADLALALDRSQLRLQYQPIVDLDSEQVIGVEALLRWHHPLLGPVPPMEFIPLAESSGHMERIGRWVLERACEEAAGWTSVTADRQAPWLSVNLSARQLEEPGLADDVEQVLAGTGLRPDRLVLELTETVLMTDHGLAVRHLQRLRDLGVRIAVDDFGTGYSSLAALSELPIDVIKVDKAFIDRLTATGPGDGRAPVVAAIAGVGHELDLSVVAEGVEHETQAVMLRGLSYDSAQGFYFARPMDPEDVRALLTRPRVRSS